MRERRPLFSSSRRFVFCVAAWGEQAARAQRRQQSSMPQGQLLHHLKHAIGAQPPSAHPSHATMFFEAQSCEIIQTTLQRLSFALKLTCSWALSLDICTSSSCASTVASCAARTALGRQEGKAGGFWTPPKEPGRNSAKTQIFTPNLTASSSWNRAPCFTMAFLFVLWCRVGFLDPFPSFSSPPRVELPRFSFGLCFFASAKGPNSIFRARLIHLGPPGFVFWRVQGTKQAA